MHTDHTVSQLQQSRYEILTLYPLFYLIITIAFRGLQSCGAGWAIALTNNFAFPIISEALNLKIFRRNILPNYSREIHVFKLFTFVLRVG